MHDVGLACGQRDAEVDDREGAARLSVVNASALLVLVSDNADCGFASEAVRAGAVVDGEVGSIGAWTATVAGCRIALPAGHVVSTTCDGERLIASGTVVVDGTLTVHGLLTGHPERPVAPVDADASVVALEAILDDFHVEQDGSDDALTMTEGTLRMQARPRLAAAYDAPGFCGWSTPNIDFRPLLLESVVATVRTSTAAPFNVSVERMELQAQLGVAADGTANTMAGTIDVDGQAVSLPVDGDEGLDPAFDLASWRASYEACVDPEDPLRPLEPVTFSCPGIDRLLAVVVGQRMVEDMMLLARLVAADTGCGLASDSAQTTLDGDEVGALATRTTRVEGGTLEHAAPVDVDADYLGAAVSIQGRVTVDAEELAWGRSPTTVPTLRSPTTG